MSTAVDTAKYSFRVTWSAEDEEFVATCTEFPSLSWLAGTPELALSGLRNLVSGARASIDPSLLGQVPAAPRRGSAPTPGHGSSRAVHQFESVRRAKAGRGLLKYPREPSAITPVRRFP